MTDQVAHRIDIVCSGQPHGGRRRLFVMVEDRREQYGRGWSLWRPKFGGPKDAIVGTRQTPRDDGKPWAAKDASGTRRLVPVHMGPGPDGSVHLPCQRCGRNPKLRFENLIKLCNAAKAAGVSEFDIAQCSF